MGKIDIQRGIDGMINCVNVKAWIAGLVRMSGLLVAYCSSTDLLAIRQ